MIGYLKQMVAGGRPKVSRNAILASQPIRNPSVLWERGRLHEDQPKVVLLRVPRRSDRYGNVVAKLFRLPTHRKIELDEMGSDVWEMCDGTLTVDALTRAVCAKYHLNRRQGEASVTAYLKMLAERRLLALRTRTKSSTSVKSTGKQSKNEHGSRAASGRR